MKRKVCLLGAFAAGKTSLVRRVLHGTFSEDYLTTVGVRIDKLDLQVDRTPVELVVWDLHGQDRFQSVQASYLHGSSGFLVVVDLSRPDTLEVGRELARRARAAVGEVPLVWVFNKSDLVGSDVGADAQGSDAVRTSARTGAGVEEAFLTLAERLVASGGARDAR